MKMSKKMWLTLISLALILVLASVVYINRNHPFFRRVSNSVPNEIYQLDTSKQNYFKTYNDKLLITNNDGITAIDKRGKLAFTINALTSQPLMRSHGKYILLADRNSKDAYLIEDGKINARINTESDIITGSVSETGMFVIVTNAAGYRGEVNVYDKKGNEVYTWKIGDNYVLDACISANGKSLAASILSTANSDISGGVAIADIPTEKVKSSQFIKDSIFTLVRFHNNNSLLAIGESNSLGFSADGQKLWTIDYNDRLLQTYAYEYGSNLVLAFENNENNTTLEFYSVADGKLKGTSNLDYHVVSIDMQANTILSVGPRQISQFNQNGTERIRTNIQKELRYGGLLNDCREAFIVGGTNVEFIKP